MKQIEPNPWTLLHESYPIGTRILDEIRNVWNSVFSSGLRTASTTVHISDLSWTQKIKHPSELFAKGDEVEAVCSTSISIMSVSASVLSNMPDAWEAEIPNKYTIGRVVKGKVTKIRDGAFMELEEGVEGLIHVSEISTERVNNPADTSEVKRSWPRLSR